MNLNYLNVIFSYIVQKKNLSIDKKTKKSLL